MIARRRLRVAFNPWRRFLEPDRRECHTMRRISSLATDIHKRLIPILILSGLSLAFAIVWNKGPDKTLPLLIMLAVVTAVVYVMMRLSMLDLVDEVLDAGDALIIRNNDDEDQIALSEIMTVDYRAERYPRRTTLLLRTPCRFGRKVSFCPRAGAVSAGKSTVIDDLISRIDDARQRAP